MGHKEVGLDKSFTLWVSFVPLTLEVSVGLELDLGYTWDVCDTTLTVSFAAVPKTTLTVAASASINLLVFDTTTSLNASFSQAVVPTVELRGDACLFDFKVERTASKSIDCPLAPRICSRILMGYPATSGGGSEHHISVLSRRQPATFCFC